MWLRISLLAFVALALFVVPSLARSQTGQGTSPIAITITDSGFVPRRVIALPGQSILFTNVSGQPQTVTAESGLFDSGSLATGAGFSLALSIPGPHLYHSSSNPAFKGTILLARAGLEGPNADLAIDHIPDVAFPPQGEDEVDIHPRLATLTSRTDIIVGFTSTATVGDANDALADAGVIVVGGLPDLGMVLVQAPDTPDFSGLDAALGVLQAHPAVEFAAPDLQTETTALPQIAESAVETFAGQPWTWSTVAAGTGGNWGLEASRFPQAWNLLEAVERKNNDIRTGIVDGGFQAHTDLTNLQIETLCRTVALVSSICTVTQASDHGNHVAGTIGAVYDDPAPAEPGRSLGVSGANPVAKMHGVTNKRTEGVIANMFARELEVWELLLDAAESGAIPNLRVVNFSMAFSTGNGDTCLDDDDGDGAGCEGANTGGAADSCSVLGTTPDYDPALHSIDCNGGEFNDKAGWWAAHPTADCGPGDSDDGFGVQVCTPNNEDGWLNTIANLGRAHRKVAERASGLNVILVPGAGNESTSFCSAAAHSCPSPTIINSSSTQAFAWASNHWVSPLDNPIVVVEAITNGAGIMSRAPFSNVRGPVLPGCTPAQCLYISAPGFNILSDVLGNGYGVMSGTSMAAPHVTGLISYLLAYDPSLTIPQVKEKLRTWVKADTWAGASFRIDAFATLLSTAGAARDMVDVSDPSKDGNRRVILGPNGAETGADTTLSSLPNQQSEPDGKIDMRDFRRFRDAWLQTCAILPGNDALCPEAFEIALNGAEDHPKKDLNFDGCVYLGGDPNGCITQELIQPRFDFNGDGRVRRGGGAELPIKSNGTPAANQGEAATMTDLEVLLSQWEPAAALTEGWTPAAINLHDMMRSGDLEVHAEEFFNQGATEVTIQVKRTDTAAYLPERTLSSNDPDGFIVITAPATELEITASASLDSQTVETAPVDVTLQPGEDRRVELCTSCLVLKAEPPHVPANGAATLIIAATLKNDAGAVDGVPVTFSIEPSGPGHATLNPTSGPTDATGAAMTTFTAGTIPATYTITALADLGGGQQIEATLEIEALPELTIVYTWRQQMVNWTEAGSTRWTGNPPAMPDCEVPGVVPYCIDSFEISADFSQPSPILERDGVLSGPGFALALDENVGPGVGHSVSSWTISDPDGSNVRFGSEEATWQVTDPDPYQDYALPSTVFVDDEPGGLTLHGLEDVAELGYTHSLISTLTSGNEDPIELHATRGDFLLIPRGDGSALRFAVDVSEPLSFERQPDGTFAPYQFCGRFESDLTTDFGYRVAAPAEWIPGATDLTRKTSYQPNDRPMPVGPGNMIVQYSFAAAAGYAGQPLSVSLPDCSINNPPDADFDYSPANLKEGRVVLFTDTSSDPEHNIDTWEWDFGDGATDSEPDPYHLYKDNGSYVVTLTVTDTGGETDTVSETVSVANLPPEPELDDAVGQQGQPLVMRMRLFDPGMADRADLDFDLRFTGSSTALAQGTLAAGAYNVSFPQGLPVGVHSVTLTATDKDGASASDEATVVSLGEPPPPPPPPPPPTPTCDLNVELDAVEQAFLDLLNEYRAQNGLAPVGVSPTLTQAAERHSDDMVVNNFFGQLGNPGFDPHTGSDGSSSLDRARDAGYPGDVVSENLAMDLESAPDALLGWKTSTAGHNENMLNPDWKAVGISREEGGVWYWATSYGDVLDCPPPGSSSLQSFSAPSSGHLPTSLDPAPAGGGEPVILEPAAPDRPGPADQPPALIGSTQTITLSRGTTGALGPAAQSQPSSGPVTQSQPSSYPPVPAFVISNAAPAAGLPVTFTNRSRDANGSLIGATLDLDDGSQAVALGPGATLAHTYTVGGDFDVTVTATDAKSHQLTVTRRVTVMAATLTRTPTPTRTSTRTPTITPTATSTPKPEKFTVNSTADAEDLNIGDGICASSTGACTLRAAIQEANATPLTADTINLSAGTYTLEGGSSDADEEFAEEGDLDIRASLTINGAGSGSTIIQGGTQPLWVDRIFQIHFGEVEMSGVTIRYGFARNDNNQHVPGGGIWHWAGQLTLDDVVIDQNRAATGGGIYSVGGGLTLTDSTISDNAVGDSIVVPASQESVGGGVYVGGSDSVTIANSVITGNFGIGGGIGNDGTVDITHTTITMNRSTSFFSPCRGGGVMNRGTVTATRTTISFNSVGNPSGCESDGGGIWNNGTFTLANSTLSGNGELGPGDVGGGVFNAGGSFSAQHSTITGNKTGVYITAGTVSLKSTILGANLFSDCLGFVGANSVNSQGHNLIHDTSGCTITGDTSGNVTGVSPNLGPLGDNGGPTLTHALLPGSAAIDAGSASCPPPSTDQRGHPRPEGPACDIGAFEASPDDFSTPTPSPTRTPTPVAPDSDNDGCTDSQENGSNAQNGGRRDPDNFWDFFDVPTGSPLQRDHAVTAGDLAAVVSRFGSNDATPGAFNRSSDPRSTPNPAVQPSGARPNYHPAYDRGGSAPGGDPWDLLPPDGSITAGDIASAVVQFGHSCV
ncbi:MAG: flexitail domain-containing putative surface protein [Dehalococcoidia bacterium]